MDAKIIFIILFIAVIVFLVLREFWCWYWKINKGLAELERLNENLEAIKLLQIHSNGSSFKNKENNSIVDEDLPEL